MSSPAALGDGCTVCPMEQNILGRVVQTTDGELGNTYAWRHKQFESRQERIAKQLNRTTENGPQLQTGAGIERLIMNGEWFESAPVAFGLRQERRRWPEQ